MSEFRINFLGGGHLQESFQTAFLDPLGGISGPIR